MEIIEVEMTKTGPSPAEKPKDKQKTGNWL
jgi:hypothetical protein